MADWLNAIGPIVSALTKTDPKETKASTKKSETDVEKLQASYAETAKKLFADLDKDQNKILSASEMQASPFFGKYEGNRTQIVGVLNQGQGLSQGELERLVRTWDADKNGELTPEEKALGRQSILDKLTQGTDPEKVFAEQEALALKLGATVSDAKMKELKALFEKHNIAKEDYTPEKASETETYESTNTDEKSPKGNYFDWDGIIKAVLPAVIDLFGGK
jgi:hypothetical protein